MALDLVAKDVKVARLQRALHLATLDACRAHGAVALAHAVEPTAEGRGQHIGERRADEDLRARRNAANQWSSEPISGHQSQSRTCEPDATRPTATLPSMMPPWRRAGKPPW